MKCGHCGSKDTLERPYALFCRKCGMETMLTLRSKLADSPVGLTAYSPPAKRFDLKAWVHDWIYVIIALMFIVGFIVAKVTA